MGGCCSKSSVDEDAVALNANSNSTNAAVTCRVGKHGEHINVKLDSTNNYYTINGKGTAVGSCFLECDTAYWEVRLGDNPANVCVGIKRGDKNLNGYLDADESGAAPPVDESWYFKTTDELKKGDMIGVYWDQSALPMLSFTLNGKDVPDASFLRVRPANNVVPAVSVRDTSSCELIFDGHHFIHPSKSSKFGMIISATSLI